MTPALRTDPCAAPTGASSGCPTGAPPLAAGRPTSGAAGAAGYLSYELAVFILVAGTVVVLFVLAASAALRI
jgi:hypothetical protein